MHPISRRLAAALLAACLAPAVAAAAPPKSDSVVKATATADKPDADGKQAVTLTLDIEKGWHLYANPVKNDDFTSNQTTVGKVAAKAAVKDVKVEYPAGTLVDDKTVGKFMIYEGKQTIKVTVTRTKGDDSPLELTVTVQACNDKSCLQPGDIKVTTAP
jgi:DsbC/DsbD-like thiol-disulfide interchange protein